MDMAKIIEAVGGMNEDQIRTLARAVRDRSKRVQRQRAATLAPVLRPGTRVRVMRGASWLWSGTLREVLRTRAVVERDGDGRGWRVPLTMLEVE